MHHFIRLEKRRRPKRSPGMEERIVIPIAQSTKKSHALTARMEGCRTEVTHAPYAHELTMSSPPVWHASCCTVFCIQEAARSAREVAKALGGAFAWEVGRAAILSPCRKILEISSFLRNLPPSPGFFLYPIHWFSLPHPEFRPLPNLESMRAPFFPRFFPCSRFPPHLFALA